MIVLLAAGRSSRMRGRDKLLETVDGETLLRRQARRAAAAAPTLVILPSDAPDRKEALAGLDVTWTEADRTDAAMSASIIAGIGALPSGTTAAIIMLADMPEIDTDDLAPLVSRHRERPGAILRIATEQGEPGNPVLFPSTLFPELQRLSGDTGARGLLQVPPVPIELVPRPGRRAVVDLDTPEAWAAWRAGRPSS